MSDKLEKFEEKKPEAVTERHWVAPRVDIYENDAELLLLADVPGVNKNNLKIHMDKDQLLIEGQQEEETVGNALAREYQAVDYRRSFLLPAGIDATKISADLKQGVLYLHLPKSEALKPRQIEVKAG
jgi:HSP20 family molecular chaperone IbpA